MAGSTPLDFFFKTKTRATRQSTKRKGLELQNEDERDCMPSKRVKAGKRKAPEGTPASTKKKTPHLSKQAKLAFGLQTPASTVATPWASSSRSRSIGDEVYTLKIRSGISEDDAEVDLPTPPATARKGRDGRVIRAYPDAASSQSSGTRTASPMLIGSSSLDHMSPPPTTRVKQSVRPPRHSDSVIELTSSEEEDAHHNPFLDSLTRPCSRSSNYELRQLSGPLSPLTQHSSMESNRDMESEFKIPELPSHVHDTSASHLYSQPVPSSQSEEIFGGPASSRSFMASPLMTTSQLLDTTDMRRALPSSSSEIVPSSQTQELPSLSWEIAPSQPTSSFLPPSSAPDPGSQSKTPIPYSHDIQSMILGPLLNSTSPRYARVSPRSSLQKPRQSSQSQVESSQLDEIELQLPPSSTRGSWAPTPANENSPPGQRTSPLPLSTSPQCDVSNHVQQSTVVGGSSRRVVTLPGKTSSKSPANAPIVPLHPPIGSPTKEKVAAPPPSHKTSTDSPTQEETPIKSLARAYQPALDDSPTQEEVTQSTPYKRRRPRPDLVAPKRPSPLEPRVQSAVEESDSEVESHGPLPALRFGASHSHSDANDEAHNNKPGPSIRSAPAPAGVGNTPSFTYIGSGCRSRNSSQRSNQVSQGRPNQNETRRLKQTETDSQDAFFNSLAPADGEPASEFGSFVGSLDSDIVEYIALDVDPPSFDLHTQDLLPVKSVLDQRRDY